ncbi:MAG: ParA family protein [Fusobacterium sp.]|uniref:ParA family protein n=1 Tax=Fusobacterium sp. TaxID=68766 RepID=UPI0026DD7849|nr:ParA family protein [Fusobacterium sp.]MDO4690447.1 ParA family protein [Fusobacterium sp.]
MGIILIKNNKGGVGKSWLSLQLAGYQAYKNKKVLILTSDSQNNILNFAGIKADTSKKGLEDLLEGKAYNLTTLRPNLMFLHLQGYKLKRDYEEKLKTAIKKWEREFDYIVIDGSPVLGLDNVFIEIAEHIIVPTFLDRVTTNAILQMLKTVDISKIRAVIPNRVGRTKLEKEEYNLLDERLKKMSKLLTMPISQSGNITKLIDKGSLVWDSKSTKLDFIKGVFEEVWREIENE